MINKQIKVLRNNHNYTQEGLVEKFNVSRQTISKWELGTSEPGLKRFSCWNYVCCYCMDF
ncbi:helix-turn-helix transcriptional regulator [Staphylococcus felis]|uniref:helix-turn-helix transcriptional regulator n=1 Tax=Staphylococcus felis TaxID=46127 RepID=UPI000CD2706C|nr:helix-turn-helix domain-containing protein [Staphylococcus felis]AVP36000.1 helix-turn-helix domain-containing protein [Staphylococcus felis]PNZ36154.1 hypothetical protein CD143_04880 [Staphylococcus felis]QQB04029.1 helix-turn-helix domain-containing protein [Staphylococcus felis]